MEVENYLLMTLYPVAACFMLRCAGQRRLVALVGLDQCDGSGA